MQISGFQKTTLLDYPQHIAATIFLGGCNFNCPFCHNSDLIHPPFQGESYSPEEILSYLKKRSRILEGVCITGGEPTLQASLPDFISDIKKLGLLIKLDTNGTNPTMVKTLYQQKLIDYVAMDIKSSLEHYPILCGVPASAYLDQIQETVRFLIHETDPDRFCYEFRTTVVNPLHTAHDFEQIGPMIQGAKQYYLQSFRPCNNILAKDFDAYDDTTMQQFANLVSGYVQQVQIRGD